MKILWIKANKLFPLHSGGDIRSFQILKHLSARHDVTLLSYYDGVTDEKYEAELKAQFPSAISVCTGRSVSFFSRAFDYLRRLPSPLPYAVARFESPNVTERIRILLTDRRPDIVVADFLDAAINLPAEIQLPVVLFQHNVESEIWRRHAATQTNPLKRILYRREFKRMLGYESATVPKFQHIIAVSQHDRDILQSWAGASEISVVPTGVDTESYRPDSNNVDDPPIVVFIGAMDWEPNIDAVEYFRTQMWDYITAKSPRARFYIVGRNPDRRVRKLASPAIEVTGRVDSVSAYLRKAAVVVVPLRIGGGTRLKIYEAMACGKAVVSTTVGAEGLEVSPGKDIAIADTPKDFAEAVTLFLEDRTLRSRYERAAFETASRHDWSAIAQKFAEVLASQIPNAHITAPAP